MAKKKHTGLIAFLVVIVVLVAAIVGIWGTSLHRIQGNVDKAVQTYEEYEACVKDNDISGAVSKVHTISGYVAEIEDEFSGWQWDLAANLPILGEDVKCGKGLAQITDELTNEALIPALTHAEDLVGDVSASDFTSIDSLTSLWTEKSEQLTTLANDISSARSSVSDCRERIDKLPKSHFEGLNDLVSGVKDAIVEVDEFFGKFDLGKQLSNFWDNVNWLNSEGTEAKE